MIVMMPSVHEQAVPCAACLAAARLDVGGVDESLQQRAQID